MLWYDMFEVLSVHGLTMHELSYVYAMVCIWQCMRSRNIYICLFAYVPMPSTQIVFPCFPYFAPHTRSEKLLHHVQMKPTQAGIATEMGICERNCIVCNSSRRKNTAGMPL